MKSVTAVGNRKEQPRNFGLRFLTLAIVVCTSVLLLGGCWGHPGETAVEVNRRRARTVRLNHQMLRDDIEKALLLDQPSTLTDRRIP